MNVYAIGSKALPRGTEVASIRGREAISEPYRFAVGLLAPDDLDLDAVVGAGATLSIDTSFWPVIVHGVVASIEHLHSGDERALYEAHLVPRLWLASQSEHSQVFVDQSVPDILRTILAAEGLTEATRFSLSGHYPKLAHVCQYHESNLDFISRLLEREGIYYFFEQADDHEILVITDHKEAHRPLRDVAVRVSLGGAADASAAESLHAFRCKSRIVPRDVTLRDYDYEKPSLDVSGSAEVWKAGPGRIHVHGENFATPEEAARLARVRAEEIACRRRRYHGEGWVPWLRSGHTFVVEEHPRSGFNRGYLAVAVEHHGKSGAVDEHLAALLGLEHDDSYRAEVVAIEDDLQFRPRRRTPKPRIYGVENGIVDGEGDGEYAQIDEQGRYKVKIDFDEVDAAGGRASTWVRMLQPHGGKTEGFHFPLRKGTEVLLTFLGGDPDRPVISGVLPNAHRPSPVTATNHTKNIIQSGGKNLIEMEDLDGKQRTLVFTPTENSYLHIGAPAEGTHQVDLATDGDGRFHTGRTWDITVGSHKTEHTAGNVDVRHDKNDETRIGETKALTVGGDDIRDVKGAQTTHVDGEVSKTYAQRYAKRVVGSYRKKVGVNSYVEDIDEGGDVKITTDQSFAVTAESSGDDAIAFTSDSGQFHVSANRINLESSDDFTMGTKAKMDLKIGGPFDGLYFAARTTTAFGATNDNFFGAKLDLFVGVKTNLEMALSLGVAYAPTLAKNFGPDLTEAIFKVDTTATKVEKVVKAIKAHGIAVEDYGLKVVK